MKRAGRILLIFFLLVGIEMAQSEEISVTCEMVGKVGSTNATITLTKKGNKLSGYCIFKNGTSPLKGKIFLSGTCRHVPPPEVPHYPLYKAILIAKDSNGKTLGKWTVEFETRTGTIEGTYTVNNRNYKVQAEERF